MNFWPAARKNKPGWSAVKAAHYNKRKKETSVPDPNNKSVVAKCSANIEALGKSATFAMSLGAKELQVAAYAGTHYAVWRKRA
jgi:hypothetical protein